jgi:DNA-binding MarR family transcriptional regulator
MKKNQLNNYFTNVFKNEKAVLALGLPISILYKHIFNHNNHLLQSKYDLNHSELDVLAALCFNGKILSPTNLYESTIFSSGGMTKILKKLKDKKLIIRVPSTEDKRSMLVKIEKKGEELIEDCLMDIAEFENDLFSVLDDTEKRNLKNIFQKLVYSIV